MKKTRRHNIEGAALDIPIAMTNRPGGRLRSTPDLLEYPVYTPAGDRVMLTIEDACPHAS